jgi:hypothetical protein
MRPQAPGCVVARGRRFDDTGRGTRPALLIDNSKEEIRDMKNPLDSLWGTVISGLVLTVVLYIFARNFLG